MLKLAAVIEQVEDMAVALAKEQGATPADPEVVVKTLQANRKHLKYSVPMPTPAPVPASAGKAEDGAKAEAGAGVKPVAKAARSPERNLAGWQWFSDEETPVAVRVARAILLYQTRYSAKPAACYINPAMMPDPPIEQVVGVRVMVDQAIGMNNFWLVADVARTD